MSDGESLPSFLNPSITSPVLLLVAGAAIGGLGLAQLLATRSAERKHAEQSPHSRTGRGVAVRHHGGGGGGGTGRS